jgi:hypothetical protein
VEARDVRLGGEEEERGAGAPEELQRQRPLGVDPHRVDAGAGEGASSRTTASISRASDIPR